MSTRTEQGRLAVACALCRDDLLHCHGTALTEVDGSVHCSDDEQCTVPADLHRFATTVDLDGPRG